MRFSTLIAFVLPLSALAAPSFVRRESEFDAAVRRFKVGINDMTVVLTKILGMAFGLPQQQRDAVIADTNKAISGTTFSGQVDEVLDALRQGKQPSSTDVSTIENGINVAQKIINQLEGKIGGACDNTAETLKDLISDARDGISSASKAFSDILNR